MAFGFDDAAQMGLGAINAGVQIFGAQQQARYNKKMQKIQRAQAGRHYEDEQRNLELEKQDTDRNAYFRNQDIRNELGDQQGPGGSMEDYQRRRLEGERSRRQAALERQGTMAKADWLDQQQMWKLQDKMARSQRTMSMISGLLMQGGGGAAQAFGG